MKPIATLTKQKMLAIWLISLLGCFFPRHSLGDRWRHLTHQPLFLLIVPAALACLPLLVPARRPLSEDAREDANRRQRWAQLWTALLMLCVIVAAFFAWCIISLIQDPTMQAERTKDCLQLAGFMVLPLLGMGLACYKLKQLGHLWY